MAITVNRAVLSKYIDGEVEYIYPKTHAELVEYGDSTVADTLIILPRI